MRACLQRIAGVCRRLPTSAGASMLVLLTLLTLNIVNIVIVWQLSVIIDYIVYR
jgi:hypothetical protein